VRVADARAWARAALATPGFSTKGAGRDAAGAERREAAAGAGGDGAAGGGGAGETAGLATGGRRSFVLFQIA